MEVNGAPVASEENTAEVPLGLLKQASMKLAAAMSDINEIKEDDWTPPAVKEQMDAASEAVGNIIAFLTNTAMQGVDEETFLREEIAMDEITEPEMDPVEELDPMDYPDEWDE